MKSLKARRMWPYLFISPYFILYAVFGLSPILFSFYISTTDWDGISKMNFVGFSNYIKIFTSDPYFLRSILNTVLLMAGYLPILIVGALLLAVALHSKRVRLKRYFQLTNFLPYVTTPVAIGIIFSLLFDWQTGIINQLLLQTGLLKEGINWLGEVWTARLVVCLMVIWKYLGYCMVVFLAGLANIPNEIHEAAYVDGAGPVTTLLWVTIPMLRPVVLFLVITSLIGGLQLLEEPMLLLGGWGTDGGHVGGPDRGVLTAVWNLYDTAFGSTMRYGLAASIAYGIFAFVLLFSLIGMKIINRGEES